MVTGFLAAVTQRAFWSEEQIKTLVRDDQARSIEALYQRPHGSRPLRPLGTLRAMRIFATEKQQTWLVANELNVCVVLGDRRWEVPRIQLRPTLEKAVPVHVDESWSGEAGVLTFGDYTTLWYYSPDLFPHEPVEDAITCFLTGSEVPA